MTTIVNDNIKKTEQTNVDKETIINFIKNIKSNCTSD